MFTQIAKSFGLVPRAAKQAATPPNFYSGAGRGLFPSVFDLSQRDLYRYEEAAAAYTDNDLVFQALNRLADMAADMQFRLFLLDAQIDPDTGNPKTADAIPFDSHPLYALLNAPNPYMSKALFFKQLFLTFMLSDVGAFVHIDDGNRDFELGAEGGRKITWIDTQQTPEMLWPLLPLTIKAVGSKDALVEYFVEPDPDDPRHEYRWRPNSVVWVHDVNPNSFLHSLSRLRPLRMQVEYDRSAVQSNVNLFRSGLRPGAVIQSDRNYVDPAEINVIQELWEQQVKGVDNWHKLLPLWGGFELKQFGFSPNELEFGRGVELARMRILATLGVHPGLLLSDVTYANASVAERVTRRYTLKPILSMIADALTHALRAHYPDDPFAFFFVDVLQQDRAEQQDLAYKRAQTLLTTAEALQRIMLAIGPDEGLAEAARQGVVTEDFNIGAVRAYFDALPVEIKRALAGGPASARAALPDDAPLTESELIQVVELWNRMYPDKQHMLSAAARP